MDKRGQIDIIYTDLLKANSTARTPLIEARNFWFRPIHY